MNDPAQPESDGDDNAKLPAMVDSVAKAAAENPNEAADSMNATLEGDATLEGEDSKLPAQDDAAKATSKTMATKRKLPPPANDTGKRQGVARMPNKQDEEGGSASLETDSSPAAASSGPPESPKKKRKRAKKSAAGGGGAKVSLKKSHPAKFKRAPKAAQIFHEEAPANETAEEKRLRRNRINDRRKRARRAMKVDFLNEQFEALKTQNDGIRAENKRIREQIAAIRTSQGIEDVKQESSPSSDETESWKPGLVSTKPGRSRLDGSILAALNLGISEQLNSASLSPIAAAAEEDKHGEEADPERSLGANRAARPQLLPQTVVPDRFNEGEQAVSEQGRGVDSMASTLQEHEAARTIEQLTASLQQSNQGGVASEAALTDTGLPSVQTGNATMDIILSSIQQQQRSSHGVSPDQLVSLLQNRREHLPRDQPLVIPHQQPSNVSTEDLLLIRRQGQTRNQRLTTLQHPQQPMDQIALASLLQQIQGGTTRNDALLSVRDSLARNQLFQQPSVDPAVAQVFLSSLQQQNQAEFQARNQLLALLQPQQQATNPSLARLLLLAQARGQAENQTSSQPSVQSQLQQHGGNQTVAQLLASVQQQNQSADPLRELMSALQSQQQQQPRRQERSQQGTGAAGLVGAQSWHLSGHGDQEGVGTAPQQAQQGRENRTIQDLIASLQNQTSQRDLFSQVVMTSVRQQPGGAGSGTVASSGSGVASQSQPQTTNGLARLLSNQGISLPGLAASARPQGPASFSQSHLAALVGSRDSPGQTAQPSRTGQDPPSDVADPSRSTVPSLDRPARHQEQKDQLKDSTNEQSSK